jgi:hypothetical protein
MGCGIGKGLPARPSSFGRWGFALPARYHPNMSSTAPEPSAAGQQPVLTLALSCTPCIVDAMRTAAASGKPEDIPEPLIGTVMVNGMLICNVRHTLNIGTPPPSLLVASADAVPGPAALHAFGLVR